MASNKWFTPHINFSFFINIVHSCIVLAIKEITSTPSLLGCSTVSSPPLIPIPRKRSMYCRISTWNNFRSLFNTGNLSLLSKLNAFHIHDIFCLQSLHECRYFLHFNILEPTLPLLIPRRHFPVHMYLASFKC